MGKLVTMIGNQYGRLRCIRKSDTQGKEFGIIYYDFLCQCGTIKSIAGYSVRKGQTISCGCYMKTQEHAQNISEGQRAVALDLTGAVVGLLRYKSEHGYLQENGQGQLLRYINVSCACGTDKAISYNSFMRGKVISCGCIPRKLRSERMYALHNSPKFKRDERTKQFKKVIK